MSAAKDADLALVKQVLQVVEGSNLSRKKVKGLNALCFESDDYKHYFPKNKHQALRRKWDDLRRLKIENYYQYLLSLDVNPGTGTLRELEEARAAHGYIRGNNNDPDDEDGEDEDEDDEDGDEEGDEDVQG